MTGRETPKVLSTANETTRRAVAISALVGMFLAIMTLWSDIKNFLAVHPLWQDLLVAVPTVAVPILAYFELKEVGIAPATPRKSAIVRYKASEPIKTERSGL